MIRNGQNKDYPIREIEYEKKYFWSMMIVLGIIGSGISMLVIPLSLIPIIVGIALFLTGLFMFHSYFKALKIYEKQIKNKIIKYNSNFISEMKNNCYIGFTLIFTGFIFAWIFAWFFVIYFFRYSSFMFAIYL